MILLDTNVISELIRVAPDTRVIGFLRQFQPDDLLTAAICEAEIRYGLERLPRGRKRDHLTERLKTFFASFQGQILPFNSECAVFYGAIRAEREVSGKPVEVEDAMIAATAHAYGLPIATRNVADFLNCGVKIINPWDAS